MSRSLASIAELVRRETGIVVPPARDSALRAAVGRVAPGLDPGAFLRALSDPVRGRGLTDQLIDEVTIQETTFLRDRDQLAAISWHRLLDSARAAGSGAVRAWSAGCASGEEAYTLALLASEAFAPGPARAEVLGTDISGAALAAATAGRYRERAVGQLAAPLRDRYFDRQPDGSLVAGGRLRSLVRFRRHNLVNDPIPPAGEPGLDLIVCRNVLIYFGQERAAQVIEALERSLRPGGMLVLGAADALRRPAPLPAAQAARPPGRARSGPGPRRRPAGSRPARSREQRLAAALDAASRGDSDAALAQVGVLVATDPLDADAHYIQGLVTLEAGEPARAAAALRRALSADGAFALAAFALGRAYDALGDGRAARRSYEQVLRTLDPEDHRHELLLQQVDIGDIAAACRARLGRPVTSGGVTARRPG
jgi:chemotaxis protein methyltransferase CheR